MATDLGNGGMVLNPAPNGTCVKGVIMVEYARVVDDIILPIVLTALWKGLKSLKITASFMGRHATVVERGARLDVKTLVARLVMVEPVLKFAV
jgi:hypothetical protein